jgi:COMPASS component SWD3
MVEYSNQPKNDDLVLGTQAATPSQAVVLGGLEGVRSRLRSPVASQQVAALSEALKYGEAGLDLVIQALSLRLWQVQIAAVSILQERTQPRVRQALLEHNPSTGIQAGLIRSPSVRMERFWSVEAMMERLKYGD